MRVALPVSERRVSVSATTVSNWIRRCYRSADRSAGEHSKDAFLSGNRPLACGSVPSCPEEGSSAVRVGEPPTDHNSMDESSP
jgi:hypothetical protein